VVPVGSLAPGRRWTGRERETSVNVLAKVCSGTGEYFVLLTAVYRFCSLMSIKLCYTEVHGHIRSW